MTPNDAENDRSHSKPKSGGVWHGQFFKFNKKLNFNDFRDDILGMFQGSESDFQKLFEIMNAVDPAIKFTARLDLNGEGVNFLDLNIRLNDQMLFETTLYKKPNVKNQLLTPLSCHPPSTTRNSVYSLALRIRRVCSDPADTEVKFEELAARLRERQYKETIIQAGIEKARRVDRKEALKKVDSTDQDEKPPHLIVTYDRRSSPELGRILRRHYDGMVRRDRRMKQVFPLAPRPVFKRGKNIKDLLTRAKVAPSRNAARRSRDDERNSVTRCNRGRGRNGCALCPFITDRPNQVVKEVKIKSSGEVVPVQGRMTCKEGGKGGFLYVLENQKTGLQYVGESSRRPVDRFNEHKRSVEQLDMSKCVARHFAESNSGLQDMKFTPVVAVKSENPFVRKHLERDFINKHNLIGSGINVNL